LRVTLAFPVVFFLQAEDGIRVTSVTGVQTCDLPILSKQYDQGLVSEHKQLLSLEVGLSMLLYLPQKARTEPCLLFSLTLHNDWHLQLATILLMFALIAFTVFLILLA